VRVRTQTLVAKFFADRGTHLAAMIAYFALLSFVPLTFLSLSLLGLAGRADESSFLVQEIRRSLPGVPIVRIVELVNDVRKNAATIGVIGGAVLVWTALSFFSVLESAFNIVYDRPNRSFFTGKLRALLLMIGSLVTLFFALLAGSIGFAVLREYVPGFGNSVVAYTLSIAVSSVGVFVFLVSAYYVLTNEDLHLLDVLPGAALATVVLETSFQVLPIYVRYSQVNAALHVFGGTALLLVWLYVMANVIVFGAELNWWFSQRRRGRLEEIAGLA
jgi:membrane protein